MAGIRQKDIELIGAGKRGERKCGRGIWYLIGAAAIPVAVLCCFLAISYGYHLKAEGLQKKSDEIESFLESEETVRKKSEVSELNQAANLMKTYRKFMETAAEDLDKLQALDTQKVGLLLKARAGAIGIRKISYQDGELSFEGIAADYKEIALFIQRLEESNLSAGLLYNGFTSDGQGNFEFHMTLRIGE